MSWICPKCYTENEDISLEGVRIRCLCGYEPVSRETKCSVSGGWALFLWACPQDI
ncbi:MAG: hypothetical protein AB1499_09110 [Nitrospirota bacterium]